MFFQIPLFRSCGRNVKFGHGCDFSYSKIEIGNDVYIGPHAQFISGVSTIRIGSKVLIGPSVTIRGGDHRTDVIGAYMYDVTDKLPHNDADVTIEDDVWIGTGATILKGVTIGTGSVIGAASLVTRSIPAYSVAVGSPAKVIRKRFTGEQEAEHRAKIGAF